jgi:transcriptional regulator with XRE-family HTH domain
MNCDRSQPLEIIVDNLTELPFALIKARMAAKMSQKELADLLGIDEQRIKECEDKNYQCASFMEILDVSFALGVEFRIAVVQVDFERIESVKKTEEKWRSESKQKISKIS